MSIIPFLFVAVLVVGGLFMACSYLVPPPDESAGVQEENPLVHH